MNLLRPDRLEPLARDHALGTLSGGARRRFERLLQESAAARRASLAWQQRLGTLAAAVPAVEPRPAVWSGLQQRLFPAPRQAWAGWGRIAGGLLAGVVLGSVVIRQQPGWIGLEPAAEGLPASYVGLLADAAGQPALLASARRHGRTLALKPLRPLAVPAGAQARLWALPRDGGAPFAVGPVPAAGGTVLLPQTAETLFFGVDRLQLRLDGSDVPLLAGHCVRLW
jgi:anti-sigma-K factor RskA